MTIAAKTLELSDSRYGRLVVPHEPSVPSSAAATDFEIPLFTVPDFLTDPVNGNDSLRVCRINFWIVKACYISGDAAMTGATATATTLALTRYDINGANAATLVSVTFNTGINLAAFTRFNLGAITAANAGLRRGDTLTLKKTHASTGTGTPNLIVGIVLA